MKYDNFYSSSEYKPEIKMLLDEFLSEPIAYKAKAEKGWNMLVVVPVEGSRYDVDVDLIPVKEWVFFTSMVYTGVTREDMAKRMLINSQKEQTMPVLIDNYNGTHSEFVNSIRENFPNWHGVLPPSLIIGCIPPGDKRSFSELELSAKKLWRETKERIDKEEENFKSMQKKIKVLDLDGTSNAGLKSLLNELISPDIDKSKLN